ncbi:unnamed protein product [Mytilus edulis]|uniref:HECT domain-containing protein n=1 Tax=Mytilus edulis TaxID=6550 RepID=A0A8S3SGB6_MYTED|nr:unnamed protein product [Mytilus edulis]
MEDITSTINQAVCSAVKSVEANMLDSIMTRMDTTLSAMNRPDRRPDHRPDQHRVKFNTKQNIQYSTKSEDCGYCRGNFGLEYCSQCSLNIHQRRALARHILKNVDRSTTNANLTGGNVWENTALGWFPTQKKIPTFKSITDADIDFVKSTLDENQTQKCSDIMSRLSDKGTITSKFTVRRMIDSIGYTASTPPYGQMIRAANKLKRVEWNVYHDGGVVKVNDVLRFITGCSSVPPGGFDARFSIGFTEERKYPSVTTCTF